MAVKKFNEWITEQEKIPSDANDMQPGGATQMAGNPHSPPALGNAASGVGQQEQQDEEEAKHISQSLMTMLDRLMPKLSKLKNKQAGMEVVSMILDKVHTALPQITQTALMKLVKGTMQQQAPQPMQSPHMPPGAPQQ
jgi:hypothetical protein